MPFDIKGITVEIGADATKLTAALKSIKQEYAGLDAAAKNLKKSMYFNDGSTSQLIGGRSSVVLQTQAMTKQLEREELKLNQYQKSVSNFYGNLRELESQRIDLTTQSKAGSLYIEQLTQQRNAVQETFEQSKQHYYDEFDYLTSLAGAENQYGQAISTTVGRLKRLDRQQRATDASLANGIITQDDYVRTSAELARQRTIANEQLQEQLIMFKAVNPEFQTQTEVCSNARSQMLAYQEALDGANRSLDVATNRRAQINRQLDETNKLIENAPKSMFALDMEVQTQANYLEKSRREYAQFVAQNSTFAVSTKQLSAMFSGLSKASGAIAAVTKIPALLSGAGMAASIASAISFEDAWAGVTKTVEGTPAQMNALNASLKQLATTTASSYEEIAEFAEIAGQMGVATDNVAEFTKTITMLNDTTDLDGETGAEALARIANIMSDSKSATGQTTMDYFSRLGSVIVDLGNKSAATESEITTTAMKIAAAGNQIGLSSADVLGFAATLVSMGLRSNEAGSSISKIMQNMQLAVETNTDKAITNLEAFSSAMGITGQEFKDSWNEDSLATILKFFEAVSQVDDESTSLAKLSEAGLTNEIRVARTAGALTANVDLLKKSLNIASDAWEENNAMTIEAEKRYSTVKSQLSQTWEMIKQFANDMGGILMPEVQNLLESVKGFVGQLSQMDDSQKKSLLTVGKWAIGIYASSKAASVAFKGFSKLTNVIGSLGTKLIEVGTLGFPEFMKGVGSLSMVTSIMGGIALGGTALALWAKNVKDSSLGALYATDSLYQSLVNVAGAHIDVYQETKTHISQANEYKASLDRQVFAAEKYLSVISSLNDEEDLSSSEKMRLKTAYEGLMEIFPELNAQLDENTGKIQYNTDQGIANTQQFVKDLNTKTDELRRYYAEQINIENEMALVSNSKDFFQQISGLQETKQVMESLMSSKGDMGWDEFLVTPDGQKWAAYNETLVEFRKNLEEIRSVAQDLNVNQLLMENFGETLDFNVVGEGLKSSFDSLLQTVKDEGVKIPETLYKSFESFNPQQISSVMSEWISFQNIYAQADEAGQQIYLRTLQSLIDAGGENLNLGEAIANATDWALLNESTYQSAQEMPEKYAKGVMEGTTTVEGAFNAVINSPVKTSLDKVDNELKSKASSFGSSALNAGTQLGNGLLNGIRPGVRSTLQAIQSVQTAVDNLSNAASAATSKGTAAVSQTSPYFVQSSSSKYSVSAQASLPTLTDSSANVLIASYGAGSQTVQAVNVADEIKEAISLAIQNMSSPSTVETAIYLDESELARIVTPIVTEQQEMTATRNDLLLGVR